MNSLDTIAAISTPIGTGGISIVRVSGNNALSIAKDIFVPMKKIDKLDPRYMYLGTLALPNLPEKCMCVYFKAPLSYTGEDMVEFQCHGGIYVTQKVLKAILDKGCRLAEGGEFTKRAFMNGKISLDESQGVIDVIDAETDSELKAGYNLVAGNLKNEINNIQKTLTDIIASINVTFDFPDEVELDDVNTDTKTKLLDINDKLKQLINTSSTGIKLKNGTNVVIVGKPNVGKSSIMNAMLNFDRAIVTSIQGTTRDTLQETYVYNGVKFNLTDTAGVHESSETVEKIGIERSVSALKDADIVLFIVDGSDKLSEEDKYIIGLLCDKNTLVVVNKSDLPVKIDKNELHFTNVLECSAISKKGINEIKQRIFDLTIDGNVLKSNIIITNERILNAIERSEVSLNKAIDSLNNNLSLDLVAVDLNNVWLILGEITGETNNEEIINSIFKNFCVGK